MTDSVRLTSEGRVTTDGSRHPVMSFLLGSLFSGCLLHFLREHARANSRVIVTTRDAEGNTIVTSSISLER